MKDYSQLPMNDSNLLSLMFDRISQYKNGEISFVVFKAGGTGIKMYSFYARVNLEDIQNRKAPELKSYSFYACDSHI